MNSRIRKRNRDPLENDNNKNVKKSVTGHDEKASEKSGTFIMNSGNAECLKSMKSVEEMEQRELQNDP